VRLQLAIDSRLSAQMQKLKQERVDMPEWLQKAEQASQIGNAAEQDALRDADGSEQEKPAARHRKVSGVRCPGLPSNKLA
jgi:hypothetical protein